MILTLIIAFLSLIILMVIHEFGHFIIAKKFGVHVEEFGIGYPPRIFGKKFGQTLYSVNLIPLGAFVKIKGEEGGVDDLRSFSNLKIWKRVLIVLGGVLAFWIAAIIIFSVVFGIGAYLPVGDNDVQGTPSIVKITDVMPDSPAYSAGLKVGDKLLQIQGMPIDKIKDFQDFVKSRGSEQIQLSIERNGKTLQILLSPRVDYPKDQGPIGIGLQRMAEVIKKYPWYQAPIQGTIYTGQLTWKALLGVFEIFGNLFSGKGVPQGAELAGPVGITVFLAQAVSFGWGFFLYFIGSISVFIALFNLFPIPALDGGKLIFLAIEKIIKRPVSPKVENNITMIFFFLLISISIFVTIRFDIPRLSDFLKSSLQK